MTRIAIKSLRVETFLGVPDAERSAAQTIEIDVVIEPLVDATDAADDIARTVDYAALADRVTEVARDRPRRLVETLAAELASLIVSEFAARSADVEIRKFVLPDAAWVAVRHSAVRQ